MKSTWVAAGLLLLTICQAAKADLPVPMVFDKINNLEGQSFEICFTKTVSAGNKLYVSFEGKGVPGLSKVYNIEATALGKKCVSFTEDITQLTPDEIYIIIDVFTATGDRAGWSEAYFPKFPEFPKGVITASYASDPLVPLQTVLRVQGDLKDMKKINDLSPLTVPDTPQYYIGIIDANADLIPCSETVPPVCDVKLSQPSHCETEGPDVGSVILTYSQEPQPGKITGEVKSTIAPAQLEVIISTEDKTITQFCQGPYSETPSCEINWDNPGEKTAQIRIMGIATGTSIMAEINSTTIHDRELTITQLGTDILEGRWIMHESEKDNQKYRLVVNDGAIDETADVDCTKIETQSHCFGYKPMAKPDTIYTFTVTNKYGDETYNELEQIRTTKTIPKPDSPQDLQIHPIPMEWHQNLMEVNTTICFSHETPNEEMIFSHYEMLMINTRVQWLKHKVMEEDDNDDVLCFTPFTINTQEFDVTEGVKVVVSQRASDGFSVIASGGSPLF